MSQSSIVINLDQFKSAAKSLRQSMRSPEGSPSHSQSLEALSHALFGKPYSEALHTILLKDQNSEVTSQKATSGSAALEDGPVATVLAYNIMHDVDYDGDGEDLPDRITFSIPLSVVLNDNGNICNERLEEFLCDAISDKTGFCHDGFEYDVIAIRSPKYTARVHILHYRSESIVLSDGAYVMGDYPGTDLNPGLDHLRTAAASIAGGMGSEVREVTLPEVLAEDFEVEDILDLARDLGVLKGLDQPYGGSVAVQVTLVPTVAENDLTVDDRSASRVQALRVDLTRAPLSMLRESALRFVDTHVALDNPELFEHRVCFKNGDPVAHSPDYVVTSSYLLERLAQRI